MITQEMSDIEIDGRFLKYIIDKDKTSTKKKHMKQGVDYYNEKHDILKAEADVVEIDGISQKIKGKPNTKAVHNFHTLLVDQKKDYLVGNKPSINVEDDSTGEKSKELEKALGIYFHDNLKDLVLGTSNKGEEWAHFYVNEEGEFDWVVVPAEQIIPFYDGKHQKQLIQLVRYYTIMYLDVETYQQKEWHKAEVWTDQDVTYWIDKGNGKYELDESETVNPRPHIIKANLENKKEGDSLKENEVIAWEEIPFLKLPNNSAHKTDLQPIKALVDLYDSLVSEGANTIIEVQSALWEVKGYEGEDTATLAMELVKYKVANLASDDGSGVTAHQLDIPYEARKDLADRTKRAIYEQGRGVNFSDPDSTGDSPSGIAIQRMFAPLETKCNEMEGSLTSLLDKLLYFIYTWENKNANSLPEYTIVFDKNMLMNEVEQVEKCKNSIGIISLRTVLENHPFVDDVELEIQRIEEETQKKNELNDFDVEPDDNVNADD